MERIVVIIGVAALIGFIVWWFFGKHKTSEGEAKMNADSQKVDVVVDGGYTPNTVMLKQGVSAEIVFDRRDPSSCLAEVMFPDFGVHETLSIGEKHAITIDTSKPGEYQYSCGMNMFRGKIVVK